MCFSAITHVEHLPPPPVEILSLLLMGLCATHTYRDGFAWRAQMVLVAREEATTATEDEHVFGGRCSKLFVRGGLFFVLFILNGHTHRWHLDVIPRYL